VVQHHLETFLAQAAHADPMGYGLPTWVEKDFRAYLRCGVLAHGVARARCEDCGHERLIAFSCKGRGICPSCNTRRMAPPHATYVARGPRAELAAHLTDHVLPHLPVRQWVLSVPKRLRPYLHHDPEVAGAVLGIFLRAIRMTLRRTSPGASPEAQFGAVSFLHRFGSALNPQFFELRSKVSRTNSSMRFALRPLGRSASFPPRRPRRRLRPGARSGGPLP
jgi:hypothetical protein